MYQNSNEVRREKEVIGSYNPRKRKVTEQPNCTKRITNKKIDKKLEGSNQTIKKMISTVQNYGEFPLSPLYISLGFQYLPYE